MKLQSLVITFIQVAVVESITDVFGYHGGNVTLPSGASTSWNLTKIEWSIYRNNTWIATYQRKKINVDRLHSYKGRLHLDTSSGDLTIRNLKVTDATEYSVDLIDDKGRDSSNKIRLNLRKKLQKPTIQIVNSNSENGECWVKLNCSSADEGVNLTWTWHSEIFNRTSSIPGSDGSFMLRFTSTNTRQKQVTFTCSSTKDNDSALADYTLTCEDPSPPKPTPAWLVLFIGVFLGVLITLVVIYRDKIKTGCIQAKETVLKGSVI
ncbi:CD48 antigen [Larimichthys crocea]|uniref:Uncharacterized protein n=1 Tax=Larimichthys crocea TaxID=215358 RepID=A0ACD3Q5P6_LARCR|nr:CD48 antigen [Larimichthys crocea]